MKHKDILKKEYAWVNENMPHASCEEKEQTVRKRIFRMNIKKAGILFLIGVIGMLIGGYLDNNTPYFWITRLVIMIGVIGEVTGVMTFARTLHNPLTDIEAAEFRVNDSIEKTGKVSTENVDEYERIVEETFKQE